ncbi:unnamed protein product [[Candida] boidinii]|uniref:Mediator of RNA polymerase II transcription subunit 21 n=1 Tax=Candida boidinii TaxID=5477 RepID=A0A9W6STX5_CANBO|nr:unnamed protein product [[Candida] boidinii]GME97800.1 unnamed protein product [[Candida] boidinii]GMF82894.1 unnamed protein product [[Candida] boidinii]GMF99630.1 unnamed protein product [[Candida] boidinii]
MTDRLTQLQICLDQLLDMFHASLTYVDQNHDVIPLHPSDPKQKDPDYDPPSEKVFTDNLNELTSDIILKTKQILTIIDTLPGIGVSEKEQMEKISQLQKELEVTELEKKEAILKKDRLQQWVDELIIMISQGIADTRN